MESKPDKRRRTKKEDEGAFNSNFATAEDMGVIKCGYDLTGDNDSERTLECPEAAKEVACVRRSDVYRRLRRLRHSETIAETAMYFAPRSYVDLPHNLKCERAFIRAALESSPDMYTYVPEDALCDEDVVKDLIKITPYIYNRVPKNVKASREIILAVLEMDFGMLYAVPEYALDNDEDLVMKILQIERAAHEKKKQEEQ